MALDVVIEFKDKRIKKALDSAVKAQKNLRPFFRNARVIMLKDILEHFRKEEGPKGKWKPLKSSTANKIVTKSGKRRGFKHILQVDGTRGGLLSTINANARFDNNSASIAAVKPYAAIHQFGGKAGRKNSVRIPARPYMWLSNKARQLMLDFMVKHILGVN